MQNSSNRVISIILSITLFAWVNPLLAVLDAEQEDDSERVIENIQKSFPSGGVISVEQHTGKLLINPSVVKLHEKKLKESFFVPGMLINQSQGLKLVQEFPFSCFVMSAGELGEFTFNNYRQAKTLRYIRDMKGFPVDRVVLCHLEGLPVVSWQEMLSLSDPDQSFTFEEHTSLEGEHFYYFLDNKGSFEMYIAS